VTFKRVDSLARKPFLTGRFMVTGFINATGHHSEKVIEIFKDVPVIPLNQ
jgi:hypothetical protein